jgi:uncharacterized protein (DUF1499 family)
MKWLLLILALPLVLIAGGLALNRPPLLNTPGPLERLRVYLTTNVAETRPDHVFSELRTPLIAADLDATRSAVLAGMEQLGWREIQTDDSELRAVVVSRLFRFRDDIRVRLEAAEGGTRLHVRSASRVGKGDLAANARHVLDLISAVDRSLGRP